MTDTHTLRAAILRTLHVVPAGDPIPPPKDDRTIDMFGTDPLLNEAIDRLIARGSER